MYFQKIGNGNPVVFLHGWGCDGNVFVPIVSMLNGFECYLVDFNGFGKSPKPPISGWNVENYAEALRLFLIRHNISKVSIVAHSFGGRVALVFAAKYPHLVDRMLLVAPAGIRTFSFRRWYRVRKYKFIKFFAKKEDLSTKFGSADYNSCDSDMRNTFVKVVNQDLSRFAKKVCCPVLIVNGRKDAATPLKHAKRLCRIVPNCLLTEIDGGHFGFFRNPNAFAQTITYFLGACN